MSILVCLIEIGIKIAIAIAIVKVGLQEQIN